MIYTVTFNPSLDYIVEVNGFKEGKVNRTSKEYMLPGGKGINVSIVLNNLGIDNTSLGFIAGFTGKEIENRLNNEFNLKTDFIDVENGYSRINFKMKSEKETEVNGSGPNVETKHVLKLLEKLNELKKDDILVLSGSIPKSLDSSIYATIMKFLYQNEVSVVVDATGDLLLNTLESSPFLIKPNNHELEEMFHVKLSSKEDVLYYAKRLQEMGARNVLISMAKDGAILVCEDKKVYESSAPSGVVQNSVGAGDSMVAGFVAGYTLTKDYEYALKLGICTGSASAFSKDLATKKEVEKLMNNHFKCELR